MKNIYLFDYDGRTGIIIRYAEDRPNHYLRLYYVRFTGHHDFEGRWFVPDKRIFKLKDVLRGLSDSDCDKINRFAHLISDDFELAFDYEDKNLKNLRSSYSFGELN